MRTRRDVWKLSANDNTLLWYGKAVEAMQKLPKANPLSWEYQAAIHGINPLPSNLRRWWAQCQHSTSFFLPWHRMYILHFERIVAAKIQSLGGPGDWALPYWDYSQFPAFRALPPAFCTPNQTDGSPNPLYVSARNPAANAGLMVLDPKDVDLTSCLTGLATTAPGGFFGGPPAAHFGSLPGALELTPHNAVHRKIGLGGGWMSDPDRAALDPIFWVHHANIDRLWEVWLNRDPRHKHLTTAYWLTGVTFDFHDASGAPVGMRTADVLQLNDPMLDYRYEDTSDPLAPMAVALVTSGSAAPKVSMPNPPIELVGATLGSVYLDDHIRHAEVPTPVTPQAFRLAAEPDAVAEEAPVTQLVDRVILQLEQVTSTDVAPTYDVYVNVPVGESPDTHEDRFVARVAMFGIAQASNPSGPHGGGEQSYAFDITPLYYKLAESGLIAPDHLRLTFVPVLPDGSPKVRIGRISLYFA